jgi:hypothetical protein
MGDIMITMGIDIDQIVQLVTHVATTGAVRGFEMITDDLWEFSIGVAILIYEQNPQPLG